MNFFSRNKMPGYSKVLEMVILGSMELTLKEKKIIESGLETLFNEFK